MNGSLAIAVLALCLSLQESSQEPGSEVPVAASPSAQGAEKPAPKYKKPRRGPAPTLGDISSVDYEMNPDGTIRRRVVIVGGAANESVSDPPPKKSFVDPDPNWTPPQHATISSSNEPSDEQAAAVATPQSSNASPDRSVRGPLLLIGIVGGLLAAGFSIGLFAGRSPQVETP